MTPDRVDEPQQDLAQFEPDPDGDGQRDPAAESAALARGAGDDTGQWVAWPDESGASAWVEEGLRELTGRRC